MPVAPLAVIFDVNETLSDFAPLRARFTEVGAPADLAGIWFASVLRDGFAVTAAGGYADFQQLAHDELHALFAGLPTPPADVEAAAREVLDGFAALRTHPDVAGAVGSLHDAGFRLATLTNGAAATSERLLAAAGVRDRFEALLDVSGPLRWKPAAAAYHYATERLGVAHDRALLVSVHPWDVDGARRAGLHAAWVRRGRSHYPTALTAPSFAVEDLRAMTAVLTAA